jgi:hypothetical protein
VKIFPHLQSHLAQTLSLAAAAPCAPTLSAARSVATSPCPVSSFSRGALLTTSHRAGAHPVASSVPSRWMPHHHRVTPAVPRSNRRHHELPTGALLLADPTNRALTGELLDSDHATMGSILWLTSVRRGTQNCFPSSPATSPTCRPDCSHRRRADSPVATALRHRRL